MQMKSYKFTNLFVGLAHGGGDDVDLRNGKKKQNVRLIVIVVVVVV